MLGFVKDKIQSAFGLVRVLFCPKPKKRVSPVGAGRILGRLYFLHRLAKFALPFANHRSSQCISQHVGHAAKHIAEMVNR